MKKIIVSIIVSITMLIQLSIIVSADYVDMIDYGFGYETNTGFLQWLNGAGDTSPNPGKLHTWYWAIDSFDPDYTYTFTFRFTCDNNLINTNYGSKVCITTDILTSIPSSGSDEYYSAYSDLSLVDNIYTAKVKINFGVLGYNKFPAYVSMILSDSKYITITTNSWGVSAEYDPGGSKYIEEYLNQIVNAGSGYPVPDGTNLDNSLNNLNNSEDVVKNKSNELMNKVSSDLTQNITQAKELSTKLKPAALQINNIYNSFMSVLPTEVKAIFIAIPLLLFVGWLVGRIRE